ncbi:MAG: ATP12 family protein [Hyphomicrobiaceae bacterium]
MGATTPLAPCPSAFTSRQRQAGTVRTDTILLDDRPARTPGGRSLVLATLPLAEAIAAEWQAQETVINPTGMPLTRLANTALDGVTGREADVRADIVKYAGSDLLCYRADFPEGLIERQSEAWDPVLHWASQNLGANFQVTTGLMPVSQPAEALTQIGNVLESCDAFRLTALHIMTTLMGSALLALAVSQGRLTAEAAWEAAHVDEDWQKSKWGEDDEATARRAVRWQEMRASATLLRLLN